MAANLVLHRGAREATLDQIARVATPDPTETWYPIPHIAVLEAVEETLQATAFGVQSRRLALSANCNQFFATLDLFAPIGQGVTLSVGIRNSIDKTLPLGFCAGHRCVVCDNLAFSAELLVNRKHTVNGGARFREAIALAAGRLEAFRISEADRVNRMQALGLDDREAESVILRAWESRIISHLQLPAVLKEWREPSHGEFGPRTRWSLFNAFTEVLRPFSQSNPQAFAGRTFRLNRLLVPPTEGPADIDAAFQVTRQELQDLEAQQEAEDTAVAALEAREPLAPVIAEPAADPAMAAVDDFWANYRPGW
jgi:hypothetical protein